MILKLLPNCGFALSMFEIEDSKKKLKSENLHIFNTMEILDFFGNRIHFQNTF